MRDDSLGDLFRVTRFQCLRLLESPRWAVGAAAAVLTGVWMGAGIAGQPGVNEWDVVWLGWNQLTPVVALLFISFVYIAGDIVLRDAVDAFGGVVLTRARHRTVLWAGTLLAIGIAALAYVLLVSAVMMGVAGLFVPFRAGWAAPPPHVQVLFGNGTGMSPTLNAHALWGFTPWRMVGRIVACATLTLWALVSALVAATQTGRLPSTPLLAALVLAVVGLSLIYEVPPLWVPTTQLLLWYHAPYWLGGSLRGIPFGGGLAWTWVSMGGLMLVSGVAGGWWHRRADLVRTNAAG